MKEEIKLKENITVGEYEDYVSISKNYDFRDKHGKWRKKGYQSFTVSKKNLLQLVLDLTIIDREEIEKAIKEEGI